MIATFLVFITATVVCADAVHLQQPPPPPHLQQQQQQLPQQLHDSTSRRSSKTRHLLNKLSQQQAHQDKARRIFDMAMTAREVVPSSSSSDDNSVVIPNNNSRRHRHRQLEDVAMQECPFEAVAAGTCTLQEHCDEINLINTNTTTTCDGSVFALWSMTTEAPETCLYVSQGVFEPMPFDETMYVEGTDVCFTVVAVIHFFQSTPEGFERGFYFNRPPFQGVFKEYFSLEPCDDVYEGQLFEGYCEVCSSAEINDELCNDCSECTAETDLGSRTIDCSNIAPELINTCATADDDLIGPVVNYLGGLCTFDKAMAGECPIEDYCSLLADSDVAVDSVVCEGDTGGDWTLTILYKELCYYEPENPNFPGSPFFDDEFFDPAQGHYCEQTSEVFPFSADTPSVADYTVVVTRPEALAGTLRLVIDLVSCDEPDFEWGGGVCAEGCGDFSVSGNACTSGCVECPDGGLSQTCTNLDATLVEPCEIYEGVPEVLRTYFAEVNAATTDIPVVEPTVPPNNATQLPEIGNMTMSPSSAMNVTMEPTMMNVTMEPTMSTGQPTAAPIENITMAPNVTEAPDMSMTTAPNMTESPVPMENVTMTPNVTEAPELNMTMVPNMTDTPSMEPTSTPTDPLPTMAPSMGSPPPLEPTSASTSLCGVAYGGLVGAGLMMMLPA